MLNFQYFTPTKVVFGKDAELKVGPLVKEEGCKKVLVHYGGQSAKKSGLLDRVCEALKDFDIDYVTLGGVVPNPHLSKVYEGIELCKKEGVDFILAVGGGSVIDSCKAIAYGLGNPEVDVWDLFTGKASPKACYPLGSVLTIAAAGSDLQYEVGTMIEIPRAALTADQIASEADFFCFGTNDLTQMTYGFSRDDAGKFLGAYYDAKIFESDPFAKLDQTGVGKLMKMAIDLGKPVNSKLHCGICGEHGGDPTSVEFCHKIGLDYVSCSPFRVPVARLAAAQAAIAENTGK